MRVSQGVVGILMLGLMVSQTAAAAKAAALDDLVKAAQSEGALVALISSSASGEADKVKREFLKRFGLNIDVKLGWGIESTEFQRAEVAMKMGSAPQFDVLFGEDVNHLKFIERGLMRGVDNWQALLGDINPRVREGKIKADQFSPAPFTGRSFLFGNRTIPFLYNTNLITEEQLPNTFADIGNPKYKGKYAVPPWASSWEVGILVYPRDKWLQIVDAAGRNAAGVMHMTASLDRVLAGNIAFAPSNGNYYWAVKAKDPKAPLGIKYPGDMTLMLRLYYGILSRARHPAAGALFALWMTTDEARMLMRPSYFVENTPVGQTDMDIEQRKLIAQSGGKLVSWFTNKETEAQLQWILSPEGQKYSDAILRALTQRK